MVDASLKNVTVEAYHLERFPQEITCLTHALINIATFHLRASKRKTTTNFIELPLNELRKRFDNDWLEEKVVKCQFLSPKVQQNLHIKYVLHLQLRPERKSTSTGLMCYQASTC